jgi:hypothetical protein
VSIKQEALDQIPAPTMNFTELLQSFQNKSLNLADLVWLSGNRKPKPLLAHASIATAIQSSVTLLSFHLTSSTIW